MNLSLCTLKSVLLGCFFLSLTVDPISAQLSFSPSNDRLPQGNYRSGIPVGIADMNNDGLDDIVRLSYGKILFVNHQPIGQNLFSALEVGAVNDTSEWSLCIGDVDRNGYNDVIIGGATYGSVAEIKLIRAKNLGTNYTTHFLPGPIFFAQGSNFADINNDGWLDLFVCNDFAESRIWKNDGMGALIEGDDWIDMSTIPTSDNSGNYASTWTDFDNDGDLDLYITKCKQGSSSSSDPKRINALFVNNGNNEFSEQAEDYGLRIGDQSWTSDFQDIDNDGDLDCFITNHGSFSLLLENDGAGYFTDISVAAGMGDLSNPFQGILRDFDNDGFVDILVAGVGFYFYHNNGDKTFTPVFDLFEQEPIHSCAIGDLNHDGFLDVYASYAEPFTKPSTKDDILWLNNTNSNNFLAVNLTGVVSNTNAVGARLSLFGDWGIQIREVRAGESYGIHNTFTQHFGLGSSDQIDSLVIHWPSGWIDKFENISVNQFVSITEGACKSPNVVLTISGETTFCSEDSVVLAASPGFNYEWSTGETTEEIVVKASGIYNVTVSDATACKAISKNITITVDPDETPLITSDNDLINCKGAIFNLTSSSAFSYLWSTGDTTQNIEVLEAGSYSVTVEGLCESFVSESVEIELFDIAAPITTNDTVELVGSGLLTATGENVLWFADSMGGDSLASGSQFITPILEETTTYWAENQTENFSPVIFGGKLDTIGKRDSLFTETSGLYLNLKKTIRLNSVEVYALEEGERTIIFFDFGTGQGLLASKTIMIPKGKSRIILNIKLPKSNRIFMYFDEDPHLIYNTNELANFPFSLGELGEINDVDLLGKYFYFYDFAFQELDRCISPRSPATLVVDTDIATENIDQTANIDLYPNPVEDFLHVQLDLQKKAQFQIFNLEGKIMYQEKLPANAFEKINVIHWARGIYVINILSGDKRYFGKVVLQ